MERDGHPPMPRPCYFITDQLLPLWPPIRRFSPPPPGGERWNGGNLRHFSRKISGQHARMHRVIWNIVEGPQQPPYWHCHVWTAPADQGLFCGVAFDRGCGHVFGPLMRVITPLALMLSAWSRFISQSSARLASGLAKRGRHPNPHMRPGSQLPNSGRGELRLVRQDALPANLVSGGIVRSQTTRVRYSVFPCATSTLSRERCVHPSSGGCRLV